MVSIILDADCNEVELPSVLENVVDLLEAGGVSESSIVSADINCGSIRVDLTMESAESAAAVEALVSSARGFNVSIDGVTFAASLAAQEVDGLAGNSQQDNGKGNGGGVAGSVVGALLAVAVLIGGAYFYKRRVDEANSITEMQNKPIGAANYTFGNVSAAEAAAGSTADNDVAKSMAMSTFAASSGSGSGSGNYDGAAGESQYHEATSTEVAVHSDAQYHMATPTNYVGGSSGDAQYHEASSSDLPSSSEAQYHMAAPTGLPIHAPASPADYRVVAGALASTASPANDYALPEGYLTMSADSDDGGGGLDTARSSMMSETSFGLSAQGSFKVSSVRRVNPLRIESDAPGEECEVMPSLMGTVMEEDADVGGRSGPSGTNGDPAAFPRMERRVSLVDEEELLFVTRVSEAGLPGNKDDAGGSSGTGSRTNHNRDADIIAGNRSAPPKHIDENAFVRKAGGGFRLASVRKTQSAAVANEADTVGAATMDVAAEA